MKRNKLLAILLTLVVVAALFPASFSAVSASNDDFYDDNPTGHCIETSPGIQGMLVRGDDVDYDFDDEEGWLGTRIRFASVWMTCASVLTDGS